MSYDYAEERDFPGDRIQRLAAKRSCPRVRMHALFTMSSGNGISILAQNLPIGNRIV